MGYIRVDLIQAGTHGPTSDFMEVFTVGTGESLSFSIGFSNSFSMETLPMDVFVSADCRVSIKTNKKTNLAIHSAKNIPIKVLVLFHAI